MSRSIRTEIVIQAPARAVWAVLTDFSSHSAWDPFLTRIEGQPVVGHKLAVRFHNGMTMRPTVTKVEEERTLEWFGKLLFGGLFDGRHRFELVAEGEATRLVHSEQFSGMLVPLVKTVLADTERGFEQLNLALKRRVEQAP
jgi:hypothetical protein